MPNFSSRPSRNDDDEPRMGLGTGRKSEVDEDTDRPRAGIGNLSNAFSQFFAASSSSHATVIQMATSATQAICQASTTAPTSYEDNSRGDERTTEKQRCKAKTNDERKGRNAEDVHVSLGTGDGASENVAKAAKRKLKEEKRKTRSAEPSEVTLSAALEEPEGGLESDRRRRKEDKKKKDKKKKDAKYDVQNTAQELSIHENLTSESKDEKRSKKSKKI